MTVLTAGLLLAFVIGHPVLLPGVDCSTSPRVTTDSFFVVNRLGALGLTAVGMIGTSASGVTFISEPGTVGVTVVGYLQVVMPFVLLHPT